MKHIQCEMSDDCKQSATHIEDKGWVYCQEHGEQRRGIHRVRKMRPWELRLIEAGKCLIYEPVSREEYERRMKAMGAA
jgi:hypothetical protein